MTETTENPDVVETNNLGYVEISLILIVAILHFANYASNYQKPDTGLPTSPLPTVVDPISGTESYVYTETTQYLGPPIPYKAEPIICDDATPEIQIELNGGMRVFPKQKIKENCQESK